ncbi:MAG: hypothetical protein AABY10_04180 [Nanoarchaeota archaeon]
MIDNGELIERVRSRDPQTIKNKQEYYALYERGLLGNKPKTWRSYEEIVDSGWTERVCMRSRKGIGRSKTLFNLELSDVPKKIEEWRKEFQIGEEAISFNQSMPDEKLSLQGEFMRCEKGLYLYYTTAKKPMNQAFETEAKHASGISALELMKSNLNPESFCDLEELLDQFPNDVFEFSAYDICVGNIPGRNTIVWEVRNY